MSQTRLERAGRRFGYSVGTAMHAVLLWLVNVSPGWEAVPFLTGGAAPAIRWVNASLLVLLVANLCCVFWPSVQLEAAGNLVAGGLSLAALRRMWIDFPFDVAPSSGWHLPLRLLVALAVAGTLIAIFSALSTLFRRPVS